MIILIINLGLVLEYEFMNIYVGIVDIVDYSFRLIEDEKSCQVSSVVGNDNYSKFSLDYIEYLGVEILRCF